MSRTILEIGYHGHPMMYDSLESFLLANTTGVQYHGIDLLGERIERMNFSDQFIMTFLWGSKYVDLDEDVRKAEADYRRLSPKDIFLYRMDGEHLAFRDQTFDEVHMHYVVSQPDVSDASADAMIRESHRVLIPGGYLVVTGENSPTLFRETSALGKTRELIERAGFSRLCEEAELKSATVFSDPINQAVRLRAQHQNFGYFLLVAQK